MRILIIPSWYPTLEKPVSGVFVREQADALSHVHDVHVLYLEVLQRGKSRKPRRLINRERGYVEETIEVPNLPLLWQFAYVWYLIRSFRSLRQHFNPDVVHCHVAVPAGWGALALRALFRVPVVITEHSSEFTPWIQRPGLRWMAQRAFSGADAVIAVSEGLRQRIQQSFHHIRRIIIIPNVVDTERFTYTPFPSSAEGYKLLFVGLMGTPQKGVSVLLDALALIKLRRDLNLHLDLVGDGALRNKYEAQARRLDLDSIVTFHGSQPHAVIAQLIQQSHTLVLPSLHESQGLVIIEALVSGRPAISTRCGGPEYLLNDTNGLIVEPGRAEPLANAITQLLSHLNRYDPYRIAADAASRYGYSVVTAALTDVYREVISG